MKFNYENGKKFWEQQSSSLHRSSDDDFYIRKANDHLSVINESDLKKPTIDLGCGAGELLHFLEPKMNLVAGLDYSDSMLCEARKRTANIEFINADVFEHLPNSDYRVWMATGSVNQYIEKEDHIKLLDIFVNNNSAESLYYFDNVDPVRYLMVNKVHLTSYISRKPKSRIRAMFAAARLAWFSTFSFQSLVFMRLQPSMGFAINPLFWLDEADKRNLEIEVVSSRLYEYRYHISIRKLMT